MSVSRHCPNCEAYAARIKQIEVENEWRREALAHLRSDELRMHINSCCDEPDADLGWVLDEIIDEIEAGWMSLNGAHSTGCGDA